MLPVALSASSLFERADLTPEQHLVNAKTSISPLPPVLFKGLTAVSFFGLLSFVCAFTLLVRLAYRLVANRRSRLHRNQFFILIVNLLISDVEQSVAFFLNIEWLRTDSVRVGSHTCWTQGLFVSVGDLSSGIFTLFIAIHTFVDIVYGWQMPYRFFIMAVASAHTFVWLCAIIGIGLHPHDIYVRAGAWCWVNSSYQKERLWLHYFWILIAEFGTVLGYSLLFYILQRRLRNGYYKTTGAAERAKAAARSIIPYPIIYVVCTLPLASLRISSMAKNVPTFTSLTFAGAMITSNGWLDVILYSLTRRHLMFGNEPLKEDVRGLDTFFWRTGDNNFGTTTTIEAGASAAGGVVGRTNSSARKRRPLFDDHRNSSTEELVDLELADERTVKLKTEVNVTTSPVELGFVSRRTTDGGLSDADDQKSALSKTSFYKDGDEF